MDLKKAIERRCDVKRYDLKAPDWRKILRAVDVARYASTVGDQFTARFILVTDEKKIEKLADASQQAFIGKAKAVVVVVSDDSGLVRSYGDRGEIYGRKHIGAVIQNFLLALEEEKLVTSWVWYYVDEQVRSILNIPGKCKVEGIFPIGREIKRVRRDKRVVKLDSIMYFGKYGEKKMKPQVKVGHEGI